MPTRRTRRPTNHGLLVAALALAVAAACAETPQSPNEGSALLLYRSTPNLAKAKPPACPPQINLTVGGLSGALMSDGGDYTQGVGGVAAHTSGANGNLMFNVQGTSRTVTVTTSLGSGARSTRIYTNTHEQSCGLSGMADGPGTAVLEVEWDDGTNRYTLRYGKNCAGSVVAANNVATSRTGNVWTLGGDAGEGIVCRGRLNGSPNWTQLGTADGFTMTLTGP